MVAGEPRDQRTAGPTPALIGRVLEPLYRAAITRRNRAFDRGVGVTRLNVPVVSVGNLSVGGTGKTPMVAHIVSVLLREGPDVRPCIAMRGYVPRRGRRAAARTPFGSGEHRADETDAYRRMFPTVSIVAQADRVAGLKALLNDPGCANPPTCIVLDDGFQHRKLARDLDIVLIDASRPPMRDRLLPAGWLREPMGSLKRAGAVVVTHAELVEPSAIAEIESAVRDVTDRPLTAVTRHVWTGLITRAEDREQLLPLDWLLGKRVVGSCAIGNPAGFMHSLRATLASDASRPGELAATLVLPDHDPYDAEMVRALIRLADEHAADAIVVTDKDWSKLRAVPRERWGRPIVRPVLAMVFDRGQAEFDRGVIAAVRREAAPKG